MILGLVCVFFKQKTAYDMRISDGSSDVCSSDLEAANREDLAAIERAEIVVIQGYLPEKLDEATILAAIDDAIAQTGASGPADMGKLMGVLKPKLAGQADMGQVSALVKKKLAK